MPIVDDIAGLRRILTRSRTIAVVGLSANWYRPSYFAAKYMRDHGYRIIPVNPTYDEVMGERCYPDLQSASQGAAMAIDSPCEAAASTTDTRSDRRYGRRKPSSLKNVRR